MRLNTVSNTIIIITNFYFFYMSIKTTGSLSPGAKKLRLIKKQESVVKQNLKKCKRFGKVADKSARKLSIMIDKLPATTKELHNEYLTKVVEMLDAKFILWL